MNDELADEYGAVINLKALRPKLADCEDALRKAHAEIDRLEAELAAARQENQRVRKLEAEMGRINHEEASNG